MISLVNNHGITKFIEAKEHILVFLICDFLKQTKHCFADKVMTVHRFDKNSTTKISVIPFRLEKTILCYRLKKDAKNLIHLFIVE